LRSYQIPRLAGAEEDVGELFRVCLYKHTWKNSLREMQSERDVVHPVRFQYRAA
jgi:hypothetical protein